MLSILKLLDAEERRQAAHHAGARPGATPEEVIRSLARTCGATTWGLFPATTDDVLLDHVGRKLGLPPLTGGPKAILNREWAILGIYLRHAWEAADPARRRAVTERALAAWDNPAQPRPAVLENGDADGALRAAWDTLLHTAAGCRAAAVATATEPLPLPPVALTTLSPFRLPGGKAEEGHQALYGVLLVLWRARARLLRERRGQRAVLARQVRQLETLAARRRREMASAGRGWQSSPGSGLALVAGAAAAVGVHAVMAPLDLLLLAPAAALGTAGAAWSLFAAAARPSPASDRRLLKTSGQAQQARQRLSQVDRDIHALEDS